LLGNDETGMNYKANVYHFRQDSSFLYYTGIDRAGLAAIIDTDSGATTLIGTELTMDDVVWTGPMPSLRDAADLSGIEYVADWSKATGLLGNGPTHYLPIYRGDHAFKIADVLGISPREAKEKHSETLIRAVIAQRAYKTDEELVELDRAVALTNDIHVAAMRIARPGLTEAEVHAEIQRVVNAADSHLSFPAIVTVNGQTLHNHYHHNPLEPGQMLLVDAGGESAMRYAGDMTRTFPVDPMFTLRQKEVYEVCLQSQLDAIEALKPGVAYKDVHLLAAKTIATGLTEIGLMKGDPEAAVAAGAHALFFPHGLGHMMGLDVHDMEGLGENYVGYDDAVQRSDQFGLAFLRLGRALQPGFVITVEPGIYFIPELIDMWAAEKRHAEFLNYEAIDSYKDFGGIRIEDDFVITTNGSRLLGGDVPKTVADVEAIREG
ncbi:MAG: aminopeptidase P family protein, partial [Bacteroidota bacterium]